MSATREQVAMRDDDIFLISYPRSGSTWLRFLLANLLAPRSVAVTFANIEEFVPDVYVSATENLERHASPRILKSHEPFDPRYRRTVYIVRDPRDVAASYRAYLMKMNYLPEDLSAHDFLRRFVDGQLDTFGTWQEHVEGWLTARREDVDFLTTRYEDMRTDPLRELARIAEFVGAPAEPERLGKAIAASDIEAMRRLERATGHLWKPLRGSRPDGEFVRHGGIGSGIDEFPTGALTTMEDAWSDLLEDCGYSPATVAL
jgi:hypothetical protein